MNNKYQEALNNYSENVDYRDYSTKTVDIVNESYDTLQELVDQNKEYTLEEVKKMWEELGYECWEPNEKTFCVANEDNEEIEFSLKPKLYYTVSDWSIIIDTKLHDLITKTLKALEKENNHDYS